MNNLVRSILVAGLCLLLAPSALLAQSLNAAQSFTPVVQAAAYSAGNAMGGLQTISLLQPTKAGIFSGLWLASKGGAVVAMTVYIFDTNPSASTCTDKVAFVLNAADVAKLAMIPFVLTPAVTGSGTTASFAQQLQVASVRNQDAPVGSALYICIVANASVTPATTSDLIGKLLVAVD